MAGTEFSLSDSTASTQSAHTPQSELNDVLTLFKALPNKITIPAVDINAVLSQAGLSSNSQVESIMNGVTDLVKNGNQIELERKGTSSIPLNESVLSGEVTINSLSLGSISAKTDFSGTNEQLNDITGLTLNVTAFGNKMNVPVEQASVTQDASGNSVVTGYIGNPLPQPVQYALDMKNEIPVQLTLTKSGGVELPTSGQFLQSSADTTGNTLPGMVVRDYLNDSASVANFAAANPVWMKNTVYPVLNEVEATIKQKEQVAKPEVSHSDATKTSALSGSDSSSTHTDTAVPDNENPNNAPPIPNKVTKSGEYSETIKVGDEERHYLLYVPKNYDPSKPTALVLALHGLNGSAAEFEKDTGFDKEADQNNFIIAYPDATRWLGKNGWTAWDTNNGIIPPGSSANDVQFLKDIINNTQSAANIDLDRIYMTGLSNGGMMTYDSLGALSNKIAAVAVISGGMSGKESSITEPISVLNMHGTADTTIPYNGVENVPPVLTALGIPTFEPDQDIPAYYAKEDKISTPPVVTENGNQTIDTYTNPSDGAQVEQVTVNGGQHVPKNTDQVMNQVWSFLEAHPKIDPTTDNKPPAIAPTKFPAFDPVQQLQNEVKQRGVAGLESDADRVVTSIAAVPNGSIDPQSIFDNIDKVIDISSTNPAINFFATTTQMSKDGDEYSIKRAAPQVMPVNYTLPGTDNLATLSSLNIGNASFNMQTRQGLVDISNVHGVSANIKALGHTFSTNVNSLTESKSGDTRSYDLNTSQPLPGLLRTIMMAPSTVDVKVAFDKDGNPTVENQNQIQNDVLGYNPWIRGGIDEVQDFSSLKNLDWANVGKASKDAGITTALTIGGGVLGSLIGRPKLGATIGFLTAPAAIDGVNSI